MVSFPIRGLINLESFDIMSSVMRKPVSGICENKSVDKLCGHRAADQHLFSLNASYLRDSRQEFEKSGRVFSLYFIMFFFLDSSN